MAVMMTPSDDRLDFDATCELVEEPARPRRLSGRERLQRIRWRAKERRFLMRARRIAERKRLPLRRGEIILRLSGREVDVEWWAHFDDDAVLVRGSMRRDVTLLRLRPHDPRFDTGCLYCGGDGWGDCTHCVRGSEIPF